jgi:hypothetical protein
MLGLCPVDQVSVIIHVALLSLGPSVLEPQFDKLPYDLCVVLWHPHALSCRSYADLLPAISEAGLVKWWDKYLAIQFFFACIYFIISATDFLSTRYISVIRDL